MAIARPAPTNEQQASRDLIRAKNVTYSLQLPKKKDATLPLLPQVDEIRIFRSDLVRTLLVAGFILILELIVWWKFHL